MDESLLSILIRLGAVAALVAANGFFVSAEFAIVAVRRTRVDQLVLDGHRGARAVKRALKDPSNPLAAAQLGITMASLALGWIGEPAVAHLLEPSFSRVPAPWGAAGAHTAAVVIAFSAITFVHIIFGEQAPKTAAIQYAERLALITAPVVEAFGFVFRPFILALSGSAKAFVRMLGLPPPGVYTMVHSEEELKMLVTASQEAGVLEEAEEQMLHRVFEFADFTAAQVMVPRTEIVGLPSTAPPDEVIRIVASAPFSRFPVYREQLDEITGILHAKDVFRAIAAGRQEFDLRALLREALTVPETIRADDLLNEMRRSRTHLAIVIDEYGGTAGLVTFEDLLERIVGEVRGEFDQGGEKVLILPDGSAMLDGLVLVADVNERFGLTIDEKEYNTIGGFALGRLGRKPKVGDAVEVDGYLLRVESLDGLRVARVRLTKKKAPP